MKVFVADRQEGKTTKLITWVLAGEKTDSYPGWSRIMLVPTLQQADQVRANCSLLDYRQVFSVREWQNAWQGRQSVEIGVDNLDHLLAELVDPAGRNPIKAITMTGENW